METTEMKKIRRIARNTQRRKERRTNDQSYNFSF